MAKQEKQKRQGLWRLLFATTALAGVGAPTAALAQDDESAVGEIVVTATKRAENLQDVPISVQALGEERLVELGITDFEEYAQHLPTLAFSPSYGPGYNRPFMRGVASGENGNHWLDAQRRHLPRRAADHDHCRQSRHASLRYRASKCSQARKARSMARVRRRAPSASSPIGRIPPSLVRPTISSSTPRASAAMDRLPRAI